MVLNQNSLDQQPLFSANFRQLRYHLSGIAILYAPAVSEITQWRLCLPIVQ
jgi:hypothetical protein